jgi:hypothetical protein
MKYGECIRGNNLAKCIKCGDFIYKLDNKTHYCLNLNDNKMKKKLIEIPNELFKKIQEF